MVSSVIQNQHKYMSQKMSKAYKIFGPSSRGIETMQGRNAQITMPMAKRYQVDMSSPGSQREQLISPFMGYNASESLAVSQVSEVNIQAIKRVAKEEFDRFSKQTNNQNEYKVLRTQIRSMKELMFELQHKLEHQDKQSQELKVELHDQVKKITEDYQQESLKRLREISIKMNENISKQVLEQVKHDYLPSSFVDVVEKLINELDDRIVLIENKMEGKGSQSTTEDPVVLAETVDLRLKKMEREMDSVKKSHSELMVNVRQEVEPSLEAIRKKYELSELNLTEHERKMSRQRQEVQKQIKKLSVGLEDLQNENRSLSAKLQALNDEVPKSTGFRDFVMGSQNMTTSSLLQDQPDTASKEGKQTIEVVQASDDNPTASKGSSLNSPPTKKMSPADAEESVSPSKNHKSVQQDAVSSPVSATKNDVISGMTPQPKEIEYRIDSQNRLLDQNNSYILDEKGKEVVLTNEQIEMLRKSQLVALQE